MAFFCRERKKLSTFAPRNETTDPYTVTDACDDCTKGSRTREADRRGRHGQRALAGADGQGKQGARRQRQHTVCGVQLRLCLSGNYFQEPKAEAGVYALSEQCEEDTAPGQRGADAADGDGRILGNAA